MKDGPLDMRMSKDASINAAEVSNAINDTILFSLLDRKHVVRD